MTEFSTIGELLALAPAHLPSELADYILSGAGSELTLRRNRSTLEAIAIEQRLLLNTDPLDVSTTFLGRQLSSPIILSPMGTVEKAWPAGDLEIATAANRAGIVATVANGSTSGLRQIAEGAGGPLFAQLRCSGDENEHDAKLEAIHAGPEYIGICLTVDGAVEARLDRFIANDRAPASGWAMRVPGARFTWKDVDRLRAKTDLPLGLKGIMHPDDARAALDHGADFVWISNHGARKFDSVRATIDVLAEVADALGGQVPLVIDGGFQRGSDVVKALAIGATLVAFGKLSVCALGLGGASGVTRLIDILHEELAAGVACTGRTSVTELGPEVLRTVKY